MLVWAVIAFSCLKLEAAIALEDQYWPYIVRVIKPFEDTQQKKLNAGELGVLIRLNSDDTCRIDFADKGVWELPIEYTDVKKQWEKAKTLGEPNAHPNFIKAFCTRFLYMNADGERERFNLNRAKEYDFYLCIIREKLNKEEVSLIIEFIQKVKDREIGTFLPVFFIAGDAGYQLLPECAQSANVRIAYNHPKEVDDRIDTLLGRIPKLGHVLAISPNGRVLFDGKMENFLLVDREQKTMDSRNSH